jgi:hypothetical protein
MERKEGMWAALCLWGRAMVPLFSQTAIFAIKKQVLGGNGLVRIHLSDFPQRADRGKQDFYVLIR